MFPLISTEQRKEAEEVESWMCVWRSHYLQSQSGGEHQSGDIHPDRHDHVIKAQFAK